MDKSKVISLSKKLSSRNSDNLNPTRVYNDLLDNKIIPIISILTPEDIAMVSFLTPIANSNNDLTSLFDKIKSTMFSFITCEVIDTEPVKECGECYGSGNDECSNCDGRGVEECGDCDGSGESYEDDEDECISCDGSGEMECDRCGGYGKVDCDYCDGTGEIPDTDNIEVRLTYWLSWDKDLFDSLELTEEMSEISSEFVDKIQLNNKTFITNTLIISTDVFSSDVNEGDCFFIEMSNEVSLRMDGKQITDSSLSGL